jgi:hypothetical protein
MTLATEADYIQVPGKVDILIAMPALFDDLFKLGESENGIRLRKIPMLGRVSGDRYGGNEGPPIEEQMFGVQLEAELAMSRWDPVQVAKLETFGGLLTTAGFIPLTAVGALLHRDRGIRFLFFCRRDNTLSVNVPCCTWSSPQETGRGTKYSNCSFSIRGNRAPEGYWHAGSVGYVYNNSLTGVPPGMLNV